jgi:hypothetical protein
MIINIVASVTLLGNGGNLYHVTCADGALDLSYPAIQQPASERGLDMINFVFYASTFTGDLTKPNFSSND